MTAKDLMTQPLVFCDARNTLDRVAELMWDHDCGAIPVVGDDGRLAGMVTDRDVCMAAYTQGVRLADIVVTSAMSKDVLACHAEEPLETAEELMREGQVHRIPVIDSERRPIGMLSLNDLARLAARTRKSGVDREVVQTLAAICAPRVPLDAMTANHEVGRATPA